MDIIQNYIGFENKFMKAFQGSFKKFVLLFVVTMDDPYGLALVKAAGNGHLEIVKALLKAGTYVDAHEYMSFTPLMCAAENGHAACVQALLEAGAEVEAEIDGYTALELAEEGGHDECVRLLSEAGTGGAVHLASYAHYI